MTAGAGRLRIGALLALTVLLLVIGGLRFARADVAGTSFFARDRYYTFETDDGRNIENLNIDIVQYLSMIEDRRGVEGAFEKQEPYPEFADNDDAVKGPVAPFVHRPALPFLASLLPFGAAESFAVVNLLFLVVGLWCLVDSLAVQGRSARAQFVGGLLYVVSLPMLIFASSLYIDGGVVGVLALGYWLMVRERWRWFVLFLAASYLVKEPIFVLAPVAALQWRVAGRSLKDPRFVLGAGVATVGWVGAAVLARVIAPETVLSYSVLPKWSYLAWNVGNLDSTAFFIIGLSPVVLPAVLLIRREVREKSPRELMLSESGPDVLGLVLIALLNLYSVVSTDLTLRTGWLVFPFAIALSARWFDAVVRDRSAAVV
jgi:hypothetical protein